MFWNSAIIIISQRTWDRLFLSSVFFQSFTSTLLYAFSLLSKPPLSFSPHFLSVKSSGTLFQGQDTWIHPQSTHWTVTPHPAFFQTWLFAEDVTSPQCTRRRPLLFSVPCASSRGSIGVLLVLTLTCWSSLLHPLVKPLLWQPWQVTCILSLISASLPGHYVPTVSTLTLGVLLPYSVTSVLM